MFSVELENGLAVRESCCAAVFEEKVDAVVTAKPVNHQAHACDNIDDEHYV